MRDITPKQLRCAIGTCPGLYDVTPAEMRCAIGTCPTLVEVTPTDMRCAMTASCPGLHETPPMPGFEDGGVIVIGKIHDVTALVAERIGPDEFAVVVPRALLKNIRWKKRKSK